MWIALAIFAVLVASSGLALIFWGLIQVADSLLKVVDAKASEDVEKRLRDLEYSADLLPQKWEEMVKEARRAEGRAHAAIRRARTELAARGFVDENLDEQAGELRELDDRGSGNGAMPAMRPQVASHPAPVVADDWEAITRRKKYGF